MLKLSSPLHKIRDNNSTDLKELLQLNELTEKDLESVWQRLPHRSLIKTAITTVTNTMLCIPSITMNYFNSLMS
jgi:hypothetical protein